MSTTSTAVFVTTTKFPNVPWSSVMFMVPPSETIGGKTYGGNGAFAWGGNFSDTLLFNCPSAAEGCTLQVYNGLVRLNFSVTAWYPQVSQPGEPTWANCAYAGYEGPGGPVSAGDQGFAYCVPIGSTAFIVAEQGLPPV